LDGAHALAHAGKGQRTWLFWWDRSGRTLKIMTRQDWDPSEQDDLDYAVSVVDDEVSFEEWRSLAAAILEKVESQAGILRF
jgi:hypothetical protein